MTRGSWEKRNIETVPVPKGVVDPLLKRLLSLCTPHKQEHHIINVIKNLPFLKDQKIEERHGNLLVEVGENSETMFSCHMDIVGTNSEKNIQNGTVDEIMLMTDVPANKKSKLPSPGFTGWIYGSHWYEKSENGKHFIPSTLGADDKVGVYLMLKLIENKTPGLYVFHIGEECGGIGSGKLSKEDKFIFEKYKRAIAFDRANYSDIITFQRGGRCCSEKFGNALADQLNSHGLFSSKMNFKAGVVGSFTDTANYREIIPECTNISVGYFEQHGVNEHLDYIWLSRILIPLVKKIKWEELPTERDPKEKSTVYYSNNSNYDKSSWGYKTSWGSGYSSGKRKTWAEADENTNLMDLPLWMPSLGRVKGANETALTIAIRHYLNMATLAEKEKFAKQYIFDMEYIEELENEIAMLRDQLLMLGNKKKHGNIEDIEVHRKKEYLKALLVAARQTNINNWEDETVVNYCNNVEKFIEETKTFAIPEHFTTRQLKVMNRFIFTMTVCLAEEDKIDDNTKKLTEDVMKYIKDHISEEGFNAESVGFKIKSLHEHNNNEQSSTIH